MGSEKCAGLAYAPGMHSPGESSCDHLLGFPGMRRLPHEGIELFALRHFLFLFLFFFYQVYSKVVAALCCQHRGTQ